MGETALQAPKVSAEGRAGGTPAAGADTLQLLVHGEEPCLCSPRDSIVEQKSTCSPLRSPLQSLEEGLQYALKKAATPKGHDEAGS